MKSPLFSRFSGLCFALFFLLVMASGTRMLSQDSDPGRHLTLGRYILENGIVPTHDMFSHTLAGHSRPPYEWLSQVFFALAYKIFNLDGVILLTGTIIGIAIMTVYRYSVQRSQAPLIAVLVTFLAGSATSIHWLPRPHIVTFLLLALWIEQLEDLVQGKKTPIYLFPLIMLFWVNAHGGFIFGLLAWAAYAAGWAWDSWRRKTIQPLGGKIFIVGALSAAATIITPDLWHNWDAVLNNKSAFILSRTLETMPPDFTDSSAFSFMLLVTLVVLFASINKWAIAPRHVFLLLGLGGMAALMARNIPLFAIACAPILSELIARKLSQVEPWTNIEDRFIHLADTSRKSYIALWTFIAVIGYMTWNRIDHKSLYQFNPQVFPVQAADWLETNTTVTGNMFNEFNWGGYLLYRIWPRHLVFLDSQSDFYSEPLMREYDQVMSLGSGWQNVLEKYDVEWAIVHSDSDIAEGLKKEQWAILYEDDTAVILHHP